MNLSPEQEAACERLRIGWTEEEVAWLREMYPTHGRKFCADKLGRPVAQIRSKAARLGLRIDHTSSFCQEWQSRAAQSKVGRLRPEQAEVMRQNHRDGKLLKTPEQKAAIGRRTKNRIQEQGHPRGMLGKKHTEAMRAQAAITSKERWESLSEEEKHAILLKSQQTRVANGTPIRPHGSWKAGWRTVGGQTAYFRSRWEANYARFLEWQKDRGDILSWEHEPKTFWFEDVKRGTVSYLPDFSVATKDGKIEYHEVKGWMDARSKTKIARMRKYYPEVKLVVVDAKSYRKLAALVRLTIAGWE